MTYEIDFIAYARAPRLDNAAALMLAQRIAQASPEDPSPALAKALRVIKTAAQKLDAAQAERDRLRPESLVRFDQAFDAAWAAMHARLSGTAKLPTSISRDAERAVRLLATLFPDGLEFLKADYDREYIESSRLLSRIDDEGHKDDLERIVGVDCIKAVHAAHKDLAEALGVGRHKKDRASSTAVQENLSSLLRAIAAYTRVLAAEVDEDDEGSRMRFFSAVAPIDDVRSERKPNARTDASVPGDGEGQKPSDGAEVEATTAAAVDEATIAHLPSPSVTSSAVATA